MAKYKQDAVDPMLGHYERRAERNGYERENIDPARTHLNHAVGFGKNSEPSALADAVRRQVADARASHERESGRAVRKDANVMLDWVVTRPKDCPEHLTERFFSDVVSFVQERYGRDRCLGGVVHMDEKGEPHVHIPVVPLVDGRLRASKLVNRADLQTFHKQLNDAVDAELGMHVSIELGEGQVGDKQLSHLSQREYVAAKTRLAEVQAEVAAAEERLERLRDRIDEVEPEKESIAQSTRYVRDHQGDGERAEALAGQVRAAREREAALEREVAESRERVELLEQRNESSREGLERLRELVRAARGRFERLAAEVRALTRAWAREGRVAALMPSEGWLRHDRWCQAEGAWAHGLVHGVVRNR